MRDLIINIVYFLLGAIFGITALISFVKTGRSPFFKKLNKWGYFFLSIFIVWMLLGVYVIIGDWREEKRNAARVIAESEKMDAMAETLEESQQRLTYLKDQLESIKSDSIQHQILEETKKNNSVITQEKPVLALRSNKLIKDGSQYKFSISFTTLDEQPAVNIQYRWISMRIDLTKQQIPIDKISEWYSGDPVNINVQYTTDVTLSEKLPDMFIMLEIKCTNRTNNPQKAFRPIFMINKNKLGAQKVLSKNESKDIIKQLIQMKILK